MKKRILTLLTLWISAPVAAWASWDLFGAGQIATAVATGVKAGADASWKIYIADLVSKALPQLMGFVVLIVCIIGALVALTLAAKIADDFKEVISEEMKQTTKTVFERLAVVFYGLIVTPTILAFLAFGLFLAYASYSGISGFIR